MAREPIDFRFGKAVVDQNRRYSPTIWAECPFTSIREGAIDGVIFDDDFESFGLNATQTTQIQMGLYKVYSATAGIWTPDMLPHSTTPDGVVGGVISGLADTANDQCSLGIYQCPFSLKTDGTVGKLWFEARVATTSIATTMGQLFVGLGENFVSTFDTDSPLGDADATSAEMAMIGFNRLESGLGVLNTSYADHAATWTNIQATANSTLAANTWIKLGMKFDPADTTRCVRFYVDGVECSSAMTKAALLALTHLDAKGLGPCIAFFAAASGGTCYTYIDRWRCVQVYP